MQPNPTEALRKFASKLDDADRAEFELELSRLSASLKPETRPLDSAITRLREARRLRPTVTKQQRRAAANA
jgi:hypothetical protein